MKNRLSSVYISLLAKQSLGFMVFLTSLSLFSEWLVQAHLYGQLFGFKPLVIWNLQIPKEYIAAAGILAFSKLMALVLLERVRYTLFYPEIKPPKLGGFKNGVVWSVLVFTCISGFANGIYICLKAEALGNGFNLLIQIVLVALLILLSLLSMLAASVLFALLLLLKPVKRMHKERTRLRQKEIALTAMKSAQHKRQEENERLFKEADSDQRKRVDVVLLKEMGLEKEEFVNTLTKKKDEAPK